ncbi:MAG: bifunctional [glutamine synthetase] adenylyltransferase/[glutamine synthetase]-adenylyl-L-tyrosine phosphorylase [Sphingomonas sp.]|jgi:glutamate-ammonia-ligase adenylyltransferase
MRDDRATASAASAIAAAAARAREHAPFLAMALNREPALAQQLAQGVLPSFGSVRIGDAAMPVGQRLRQERRRLALLVAVGDLAGVLSLNDVTGALTDFADYALDAAIAQAMHERTPDAPPRGFAAIALGKQGSRELNYSSDIDPILLFDPAQLPCRPREAPEDAAVRIGRRVIELLQARDGDGYVLRVDLRLRPAPEVTPIALSVNAAISHYESQALAWERAAFIRARAAAGDIALGAGFLAAIQPFVWRRGLDFGAIAEIRDISRRIRDHHAQGQNFGPGFDLKRGRGGIREVEFFAQIHQLIHGGRVPALRVPATGDALGSLAEHGVIDREEAAMLAGAYELLRTIEHRVQMIDDRQTHSLPMGAGLEAVARLHGVADGAALLALLAPRVAAVGASYDGLEPEGGNALSHDPVRLRAALIAAGFDEVGAASAAARVEAWRAGAYPALRSPPARQALEAALPGVISAIGAGPDPAAAMIRLDRLLGKLPSAINLFRLLEAEPPLARLLALILSHAPPLAELLARRPVLLDGLIDTTALDPVEGVGALARHMRCLTEAADYQALLDGVRTVVGERRFALGAQLVAGASDPLSVAAGYARVAEAAIMVLAEAALGEFSLRHGRVPGSELVILALGRLGGGALTHASDLDLIFLFTGDHRAESDGEKPLGAVHYYNRLAQRLVGALSVPTAAGALYDVDTRLRPSGAQGPLSVSTEGFARYQQESAWTWEHMALSRARVVYGSAAARAEVEGMIATVLAGARPPRAIAAQARAMRADIAAHKPPAGPLDIKLLEGGLVDLEFAVHVMQLERKTGFSADLAVAISALVAQGLLPPAMADAHDFLMRLLVTQRLVAPDAQPPAEPTRALIAGLMGLENWEAVMKRLATTLAQVVACWHTIAGE